MSSYSTTGASTVILALFSGKPKWKITGGSGFTAFTFSTTKTIPHIENLSLSQNSFSKSANLVLKHATILADTIKYSITDDNGNNIIKSVAGSSSGFTFTPVMMTSLTLSSGAAIQIIGSVQEYSALGGLFVSASEYIRPALLLTSK
jgi:hypothetical protein